MSLHRHAIFALCIVVLGTSPATAEFPGDEPTLPSLTQLPPTGMEAYALSQPLDAIADASPLPSPEVSSADPVASMMEFADLEPAPAGPDTDANTPDGTSIADTLTISVAACESADDKSCSAPEHVRAESALDGLIDSSEDPEFLRRVAIGEIFREAAYRSLTFEQRDRLVERAIWRLFRLSQAGRNILFGGFEGLPGAIDRARGGQQLALSAAGIDMLIRLLENSGTSVLTGRPRIYDEAEQSAAISALSGIDNSITPPLLTRLMSVLVRTIRHPNEKIRHATAQTLRSIRYRLFLTPEWNDAYELLRNSIFVESSSWVREALVQAFSRYATVRDYPYFIALIGGNPDISAAAAGLSILTDTSSDTVFSDRADMGSAWNALIPHLLSFRDTHPNLNLRFAVRSALAAAALPHLDSVPIDYPSCQFENLRQRQYDNAATLFNAAFASLADPDFTTLRESVRRYEDSLWCIPLSTSDGFLARDTLLLLERFVIRAAVDSQSNQRDVTQFLGMLSIRTFPMGNEAFSAELRRVTRDFANALLERGPFIDPREEAERINILWGLDTLLNEAPVTD